MIVLRSRDIFQLLNDPTHCVWLVVRIDSWWKMIGMRDWLRTKKPQFVEEAKVARWRTGEGEYLTRV